MDTEQPLYLLFFCELEKITYLAYPPQVFDAINPRLPGHSLGIPTEEVNREIAKTLNKGLGK